MAAILASPVVAWSQAEKTQVEQKEHGRPALVSTADLAEYEQLSEERQKLIRIAIEVAKNSPWLPYKYGGSTPEDGGFDCSGAMFFVMGKFGLEPPRTSAAQFLWLQKHERLHTVPESATELSDPSLKELKPGDLLFWSGTYEPTDGRAVNITHVAMYLGTEKTDGRAIMINATDGRSYRGKQANGYGVYDFRLPRKTSRSKFVGYGTPPGISASKAEAEKTQDPEAGSAPSSEDQK
ncbi:C40 family peptidase [Luteolibacter pohnpeiensis]|uniref:C40 family peptidase n=1 Tax=Luteolibacter pohnpeiensis TaxID=454153 RepID=A0A934S792_9BACT|nr:NlpC/P60 family protein [Luteolibacter pohnpeiensis]MBK1882509.1 C40 family peptidase [Luteolibacter pohnpeiensis]